MRLKSPSNLNSLFSITIVIVMIFLVLLTYNLWFNAHHNYSLSTDPAAWGQFGDYIGGILNPIIAFMAFFWLLQSVKIQKTELEETRNELAKQAKTSLEAAKLSAWSIRLENILSDISQTRAEINYLAPRIDSARVVLISGEIVKQSKALEELKLLHERLQLFNEMRETIDSEIKKLLIIVESGNI